MNNLYFTLGVTLVAFVGCFVALCHTSVPDKEIPRAAAILTALTLALAWGIRFLSWAF